MKISLEMHFQEVTNKLCEAVKLTIRDLIVDIAQDAIKGSPHKKGHNRRSIAYQIEGSGKSNHPDSGESGEVFEAESQAEAEVGELKFNEAAVYPTSGYGGYLETGTVKMAPRPYLKPAMDKNFTEQKAGQRLKENLGE
jgi:HK97 gp10 family phage protein